jgi:serine/threonine protein kinase
MIPDQDDDKTIIRPPSRTGADATPAGNPLPVGTRVNEFEIVSLIGVGGFGIVYRVFDHSLGREVALKEYMPQSLAARGASSQVQVLSEQHIETFEAGRRSFVNEARLLAMFDHPSLVKVYRFWEANGTAYMVMPLYRGRTLKDALKAMPAPPDEAWLVRLLAPLLDAVETIHEAQVCHRDIAPDNIMLLAEDRPLLLDFGAARRVVSEALTVILKPGYAPIEQYADEADLKQGPWTDVYALSGCSKLSECTTGSASVSGASRPISHSSSGAVPSARSLSFSVMPS